MVSSRISQTVRTKKATIKIVDNDIFYVKYDNNVILELADFKEARAYFEEWSLESPFKLLVEFPEFTTATSEARKFAEEFPIDALAEAIVFKSLGQRILVKFYLLVHKQQHPVHTFRSFESAVKWLRSLE